LKYLISYDLRKQRNYEPLWALLRNSGAVKILESSWLVDSPNSSVAIRDHLRTVIDNDDGLIVLPLAPGVVWATFQALPLGVEWLRTNVAA
jgi:hypothetical protein